MPVRVCEHGHVTAPTTANALSDLTPADLEAFLESQRTAYAELQDRGLKLDLTRGKPSAAQLNLCNELLSLPKGHHDAGGTDVRNYGGLSGITELRAMFAELLWVETGRSSRWQLEPDDDARLPRPDASCTAPRTPPAVVAGGDGEVHLPVPATTALHDARVPTDRDAHGAMHEDGPDVAACASS